MFSCAEMYFCQFYYVSKLEKTYCPTPIQCPVYFLHKTSLNSPLYSQISEFLRCYVYGKHPLEPTVCCIHPLI